MVLKAFDEYTGQEVQIGDSIVSGRGDHAVLVHLSRPRGDGRSGKVVVQHKNKTCGEPMTINPRQAQREYYDSVWGLRVEMVEPEPVSNEMVSSAEPFMRLT